MHVWLILLIMWLAPAFIVGGVLLSIIWRTRIRRGTGIPASQSESADSGTLANQRSGPLSHG